MFRITSLNSFSVLIKIGIGLITSKFLAVFVGPSGMALVGNFRNFIASIEGISTLGFQNGIVKYVAESENDKTKIAKIISTAFISLLTIVVVLSFILFVFSEFWSHQIFGINFQCAIAFRALALALPWYATSIFLLSVINGLHRYKKVIYINIIGNLIGLLVSVFMIFQYKTVGSLLSIVISPSILFFVTFYFINKEIPFFRSIKFSNFDFEIIKKLSSFSLMTLVSSVIGPIVILLIRQFVIQKVGLEQAGFWETISRISSYYLMFVTSVLSIYFLPKLVVAKDDQETRSILWGYYKSIIPVFIIGVIVIYFLRFFVIKILFTKAFLPVTTLFFWQLLGDIFKVSSWILGFNLLAKKMTIVFITTELFSLLLTYLFSVFFVSHYGIQGIVMAHALSYFIYLMVLGIYFRKILFQ